MALREGENNPTEEAEEGDEVKCSSGQKVRAMALSRGVSFRTEESYLASRSHHPYRRHDILRNAESLHAQRRKRMNGKQVAPFCSRVDSEACFVW